MDETSFKADGKNRPIVAVKPPDKRVLSDVAQTLRNAAEKVGNLGIPELMRRMSENNTGAPEMTLTAEHFFFTGMMYGLRIASWLTACGAQGYDKLNADDVRLVQRVGDGFLAFLEVEQIKERYNKDRNGGQDTSSRELVDGLREHFAEDDFPTIEQVVGPDGNKIVQEVDNE